MDKLGLEKARKLVLYYKIIKHTLKKKKKQKWWLRIKLKKMVS